MRSTIWKATLEVMNEQIIKVPKGAKFLCVMQQHGLACLWFRCDPDSEPEPRKIIMRGTGHEDVPVEGYLGSFMLHGGLLVFHVFDGGTL